MQMEIFLNGRDTKGTCGFPGRQGIFRRFPAPPVASCPGQTRPLGSDSVRAIWRYAQKTPENPQCLPGKPHVPSAVPRLFKRSRKRKKLAMFWKLGETLSRTGFTASAVNLFVRRSKKNEFELFWGNETGGGGKVGRDVSEAFGFLSR